jgi:hypothetical protein
VYLLHNIAVYRVPFASFITLELLRKKDSSVFTQQARLLQPLPDEQYEEQYKRLHRHESHKHDDDNARRVLAERAEKQRTQDRHTAHDSVELATASDEDFQRDLAKSGEQTFSTRWLKWLTSAKSDASIPEPRHEVHPPAADDYYVRIVINYTKFNKIVPYKAFQKQMNRYSISEDEWTKECQAVKDMELPQKFDW